MVIVRDGCFSLRLKFNQTWRARATVFVENGDVFWKDLLVLDISDIWQILKALFCDFHNLVDIENIVTNEVILGVADLWSAVLLRFITQTGNEEAGHTRKSYFEISSLKDFSVSMYLKCNKSVVKFSDVVHSSQPRCRRRVTRHLPVPTTRLQTTPTTTTTGPTRGYRVDRPQAPEQCV